MSFLDYLQSLFSGPQIIANLKQQIAQLQAQVPIKDPNEDNQNNKYPKANLTYARIETDATYQIDLRDFINPIDNAIPIVTGNSDEEKALNALSWVIQHISYVPDSSQKTYKTNEYWAYPYQTLFHQAGDCEDGAILLYNILLKSGVPYWKLRLSGGLVKDPNTGGSVGHCYLTFYYEEADRWVLLDWCYYPNLKTIDQRPDYKDEKNYLEVWFSWNQLYCFTKGLNAQAKKLVKAKTKNKKKRR